MFNKILIANRGEIACRIIARPGGSGRDRRRLFRGRRRRATCALADEAVLIGPAAGRARAICRRRASSSVARRTGAEAIHPGYGFLSENADFAEACADAGIVFIGPPPAAIRAMGLKDAAKALMEQGRRAGDARLSRRRPGAALSCARKRTRSAIRC